MQVPADKLRFVRFGAFEVDLQEQELRKSGIRIKLQEQPFQILTMLLERPAQTVSREELRRRLWPADTFVDFDHGLNTNIKRLREALGDDSENPRFIETLHRRGYRFIAPVDGARTLSVENGEQSSIPAVMQAPVPPSLGKSSAGTTGSEHRWGRIGAAVAMLIVLGAAGFWVHLRLHRSLPTPFQKFTVTQITNSGKAVSAAISPDGRYVASVLDENGMQSIWLRNLPTGSDTQIISPVTTHYDQLAFSPDGNYIYFRMKPDPNSDSFDLYRCPVLGGMPQFIVRDLQSFAFSPDGQRIAYARLNYPENGKYRILTSSLEGENETVWQVASTVEQPWHMTWSKKGDEIYSSTYAANEGFAVINALDMNTGKSHHLATFKDKTVCEIQEAPDGSGLFATYRSADRWQLGFLRSSGEDIEPIHQDLNSCGNLTLSADGRTLATVYTKSPSTVYVLSKTGNDFREPLPVLTETTNDVRSLNWSADGNLLVGKADTLLKMGADGKSQEQLLKDPAPFWAFPCSAKYLVLMWEARGVTRWQNIWRLNADGSNPVKLTNGKGEYAPVCSPDEKWLYYGEGFTQQRLSRVPLDGSGKAEIISHAPPDRYFIGPMTISPDGKTLAIPVQKPPLGVIDIAVYEVGSSRPPRIIAAGIAPGAETDLQSTHEGGAVAYVRTMNGVDNLWVNHLDGSAPYPITDLKSASIWGYRFSLDGKRLAVLLGRVDSDIVLLQETKP